MQHEITKPSKLLNKHGELIQKGYAKSELLQYRRKDVRARRLRLKEWDYYLIYNGYFGIALTIGSVPFSGLISATLIDFQKATEKTKSTISVYPIWRVKMPESSNSGDIIYQDKTVSISIKHEQAARTLYMKMKGFEIGNDLEVLLTLFDEPNDSMFIATPFREDKKKFFYNRKIIGMRASGEVRYKGRVYEFSPDTSFGILDWGRGVWPYKTTWYWSAGQGMIDNKVFGFNLGYGFGDTSAATENMLFYDGIATKLKDVAFIISKNKHNEFEYLNPWVITSSDRRFEGIFVPILDRSVDLSALIFSTNQHQVFGKFTGIAVLADGKRIELSDFLGFAERVENRW